MESFSHSTENPEGHDAKTHNEVKLLIVTQTVDENDPILGFFCRWIEEFAEKFESITVIALNVGESHLPKNVTVHSLGKNQGVSRIKRFFRYLSLLFDLREAYTHVFVHMNPEYVIAGAPLWLILGKKAVLWYNHSQKSSRLSIAARLVKIVFYTSPYAASAGFSNSKIMPAGIDMELFKPVSLTRNRNEVYFQGRIAPSKRVDEICKAFRIVREKNNNAVLTLVGPVENSYGEALENKYSDLIKDMGIVFHGPRKSSDTPSLYSHAGVSINLTAAGNYDKTVLESMACETPVIVSSSAFSDLIPNEWTVPEHDTSALAQKITDMCALPGSTYQELGKSLRRGVELKHSVTKLGVDLFNTMKFL